MNNETLDLRFIIKFVTLDSTCMKPTLIRAYKRRCMATVGPQSLGSHPRDEDLYSGNSHPVVGSQLPSRED